MLLILGEYQLFRVRYIAYTQYLTQKSYIFLKNSQKWAEAYPF